MGRSITITPATFEDIEAIPLPDGMAMCDPREQFKSAEWLAEHGRLVCKAGIPVAVFGVVTVWKGVGHAFAYVHRDAHRYPVTLITVGREMAKLAFEQEGLWRLQVTVDADFDAGIRYLFALGFVVEGLMKEYGPDRSDHLMMARMA